MKNGKLLNDKKSNKKWIKAIEGTLPLPSLPHNVNPVQYSALIHIDGTNDAGMGTFDFLLDLISTFHVCLLVGVSFTASTYHQSSVFSLFLQETIMTIGHDFPQCARMNSSEPANLVACKFFFNAAKSESFSLSLFCSIYFVDI